MIYTRGQPQDYDAWAAAGCTGWSFADVLPYFKRREDNARGGDAFHGEGGPLKVSNLSYRNPAVEAFVEAAAQAGFPRNDDFNGASQEGVGPYQVFQRNGKRYNAARAYLAKAPANLCRSSPDAGRRRSCSRIGGPRRPCARRQAANAASRLAEKSCLSGGAFGSPQLLMLSGIGPADHLRELWRRSDR